MTPASKAAPGGVRLDPGDAEDRRIIARQVRAARQAGKDGRDRARTTRGRADLEAAYDEGAAGGTEQDEDQDEGNGQSPAARPSRARRVWNGINGGTWRSLKPRDPRRRPTRARDAGGLVTGMLIYTGVVVYLRYGPAGWKGWLSAKFLNKPMTSSDAATAAGTKSKSKPVTA